MEDIFLTVAEHKLLRKHQKSLEARYNVKLNMPKVDESTANYSCDVIFASICGNKENIECVKKFLQRKKAEKIPKYEESNSERTTVPVITLSDSSDDDDEDASVLIETSNKENFKKRKKPEEEVLTVIDITSPAVKDIKYEKCTENAAKRRRKERLAVPCANFIPIKNQGGRKQRRKNQAFKKRKKEVAVPVGDFIPLTNPDENEQKRENQDSIQNGTSTDLEVVALDETPVPSPIPMGPRLLRPVVIDGSNVAREHGKTHNTFSCKGIKICVDYFLNRGHSQVTTFVPHYRRHCTSGPISTTDQEILEELYRTQHVVYTPSRRVQGKRMTCYDDRFIVELATMTGGVILSNDNYKDLIGVSDAFKKTIEERLLMFCFVGDILMIPNDPLGRNGPCLDDFLSFPVKE
ncbi:probable ribonuclease ZC3H12C isoform X1 [Stegodyphus dumicola]|uniref:probable ribonuclease ZC3H12C isoform X1 n=1 Tax=Stegodyphus dumicola TaxID=202533 RepID=UPI0015AD7C2C|nr:probable ribonuclease ZC3H12C isoform X1 [Stegodyphus dumicola]